VAAGPRWEAPFASDIEEALLLSFTAKSRGT
jgi:hypothetical protein